MFSKWPVRGLLTNFFRIIIFKKRNKSIKEIRKEIKLVEQKHRVPNINEDHRTELNTPNF